MGVLYFIFNLNLTLFGVSLKQRWVVSNGISFVGAIFIQNVIVILLKLLVQQLIERIKIKFNWLNKVYMKYTSKVLPIETTHLCFSGTQKQC